MLYALGLFRLLWFSVNAVHARGSNTAALYDVGNVQVNKCNDYVAACCPNHGTLQGAGLSVSWHAASNIIANATWAFRIGNNPFTDDPSQNQDGSSSSNRFWLNASVGSDGIRYVGALDALGVWQPVKATDSSSLGAVFLLMRAC